MSGELDDLLRIARRAAAIAGEVIMPLYQSSLTVELKADRTPVTLADRRAEEAVRAFIEAECPSHGIIGEELDEKPGDGRFRWVLDPIDGTKSFIHQVPLFGTLIALERDGEPVVGVIACHAVGETAYASKGGGAFLNDRPARVSGVTALADATLSMTSYHSTETLHSGGYHRLVAACGLARAWGDCYGYLALAAGRVDVMLDAEMNLWDVAALWPVVTEAGGRLSTWEGENRIGDSVIATNGLLHESVLAALRG